MTIRPQEQQRGVRVHMKPPSETDTTGMLDVLFEPVRIGDLELPNRVVFPAHTTNFGERSLPTRRHADYHVARAKGGTGLIISEAIRVHPTSAGRDSTLGSYHPDAVRAYRPLTGAVHDAGARMVAQIMHAGRQAAGDSARTAAWGATAAPWTTSGPVPHQMTASDIATVVSAFGDAAARMIASQFDGIEVHLGHGHLIQQFLSPAVNTRTDGYGGSDEARLRMALEVLDAVFGRVERSVPVGIRISADEFLEGGLDPSRMVDIVGELDARYPLAFVHVSHSAYVGRASLATQIADMSYDPAPFRRFPRRFKAAFPHLPVIAVCRIDTLELAADLVRSGDADLVAMARAQIADPDLVRKGRSGRSHETRSCLACNQACIGRIEMNLPLTCVVNPDAGDEARASARRQGAVDGVARLGGRRVLVVGGGPAGLEAAVTARRAGCDVVLVEGRDHLGGQVTTAARVPGRKRLGLLVSELERDARREGVHVVTGHVADAAWVLQQDVDHVLVATVSVPAPPPRRGTTRLVDVVTAVEELCGSRPMPGGVAVLDEEGGWPAAGLVEALARRGSKVQVIVPTASVCARITTYSRVGLLERWRDLGVVVRPLRRVVRSSPEGLVLVDSLNGTEELAPAVDLVVDVSPPRACDALYRDLESRNGRATLHLVGDAVAPRSALEAVFEARTTVLDILADAPDGRHEQGHLQPIRHDPGARQWQP